MPLPALEMRLEVGGDIIKAKVIRFLKYLWNKLHKEKTTSSIKIEAVNSNVILIINKD